MERSVEIIAVGFAMLIMGALLGYGLNYINALFPSPQNFGLIPWAFIGGGIILIAIGIYSLFERH